MKINEKNLIKYATTPPFDLEGYLNKRSSNKAWRKRYCVLKNNFFFYFDKKGESEPIGLIILENCTIELVDELDGLTFQVAFDNRNIYTFSAANQALMETWMKSLAGASYEYKKAMVLELQRQLNDINKQQETDRSQNQVTSTELNELQQAQLQSTLRQQQQLQQSITNSPKPPPRRQNPFNRPAPPVPGTASGQTLDYNNETKLTSLKHPTNHQITNDLSQSNSNSLVYNWETFGDDTSVETRKNCNGNHNKTDLNKEPNYQQVDRKLPSPVSSNENSEKLFHTIHERFKNIILEDISQYRNKKENLIKPLIIF